MYSFYKVEITAIMLERTWPSIMYEQDYTCTPLGDDLDINEL